MKKHFLKSFALLAMLFSALTLSAQSGVDWSTITWTGNGSGDAAATEKYKVSPADGLSVVNIQKPGFSDEVGIYVTVPHGISECSINSKIDGAGVVLYLSSFEFKETKVTIKHAQGTITFWVYYEDGIDWSTIAWTGNGSDAVYTDKYKVSPANNLSVVNIQKPGFADEVGIYVTLPAGISDCSIGSKIDGAGVVLYLSSFVYKETKVTITYAQGTCTFWVYYADGIEGQDLGSNEEDESGWGSVNWVTGSNNKYKVSHDCLQEVVSVQQPAWAEETGIYVVAKGTINSCTATGAIQGGGMVIYLSNFTAKETEVTIDYAGGSCTFVVYYADGAELDPSAPVVTTLTATPASNLCKVGENIAIAVVAKDQNGMTMADAGTVEYTISPADAGTIVDNVFTPTKAGLVTITASVGTVQAEPVEVYAYAGDNLALSTNIDSDNKIIAQSDINPTINDTKAFFAVDGNEGSVWQGSYTNGTADNDVARTYNAWFVVDLGAYYDLDLVSIKFEGGCSQAYTLDVSEDYVTWKTAHTYTGSAGVNHHTDALYGTNLQNAQKVRFVRFWSTKAATGYGMKIWEMQVYGSNRQEVTKIATKPVINSATVTSKTIEQAILSINTTSFVAIAKYRVVDNANGIDWFVSSLNPAEYVIAHLKDNTSYTLSLYAYDIDGNISDVFTMEEFKTLADNTKPTTASPTPTQDEEDVLAFYSDTYIPVINWGSKKDWNGAGAVTENAISANNYLMYKDVTWWGWTYGVKDGYTDGTHTGVNCSDMEYLHIDIWSDVAGSIWLKPIYGGTGLDNNENYYAVVEFEANKWNSVDIAIEDFQGSGDKHDFSSIYQLKFDQLSPNTATVSIDNVYFWKSAGTAPVESVSLDKTTATIEVEETLQLNATVLPIEAGNKNIIWTSSNTSVATVSAEGVVTGLTEGITTITATTEDGNKTATCAITVEPITAKTWWGGPVALTLAEQEHYVLYSFTRNENKTITYTAIFDQGNIDVVKQVSLSDGWNELQWADAENTTVSWTSTSTHNAGEKILGFFYFGGPRINFDTEAIAYIVGSSNERPILSVESVTLDKTTCDLMPTETAQLVATVNPGYVANKNVVWTSSNTAVATVDANGLVTAVAAGSATITATSEADNTKTATCTVNVMAELTDATYNANAFFIENGRYVGFNYSIIRTKERKLRYEATVNGDVVGLVVEFNDGNWHNMAYDADSKSYSYITDKTYADGIITVNHFFYVKFEGGAQEVDADYTVGSTNSPVPTMVAINESDEAANVALTGSIDAVIGRAFTNTYWQTISLPFALNQGQLKEVFGNGVQVAKLNSSIVASTDNATFELNFVYVSEIEAATPYLIHPSKEVAKGQVVRDVPVNLTPNNVVTTDATMIPVLFKSTFPAAETNYWLAENGYLYGGATDIEGMRAYFTFPNLTAEQASKMRARVVFNENTETSVDNITMDDAVVKIIQNGQLIIIRNGEKYNVQGQKL